MAALPADGVTVTLDVTSTVPDDAYRDIGMLISLFGYTTKEELDEFIKQPKVSGILRSFQHCACGGKWPKGFSRLLGPKSVTTSFERVSKRLASVGATAYKEVDKGDAQDKMGVWDEDDWGAWVIYRLAEIATFSFGPFYGHIADEYAFTKRIWHLLGHLYLSEADNPLSMNQIKAELAELPPVDVTKIVNESEQRMHFYMTTIVKDRNAMDAFDLRTAYGQVSTILKAIRLLDKGDPSDLGSITLDAGKEFFGVKMPEELVDAYLENNVEAMDEHGARWTDYISNVAEEINAETDNHYAKHVDSIGNTAAYESIFGNHRYLGPKYSDCFTIMPNLTPNGWATGWKQSRKPVVLRSWQITGAAQLVKSFYERDSGKKALGAMLCDSTGLGKTHQIAMLLSTVTADTDPAEAKSELERQKRLEQQRPSVILVPEASMMDDVIRTVNLMDKRLHVFVYYGKTYTASKGLKVKHLRDAELVPDKFPLNGHVKDDILPSRVVIVSTLGTWTHRFNDGFRKRNDYKGKFGVFVIDEAHTVRNGSTAINKIILELRPQFCVLCTATPFHNKLESDIGGYLRLLAHDDCSQLFSAALREFPEGFNPYLQPKDSRFAPLLLYLPAVDNHLRKDDKDAVARCAVGTLDGVMIRRLYSSPDPGSTGERSIAHDLPKLFRHQIQVQMRGSSRQMYEELWDHTGKYMISPNGGRGARCNGGILRRVILACSMPAIDYIHGTLLTGGIEALKSAPGGIRGVLHAIQTARRSAHPGDSQSTMFPPSTSSMLPDDVDPETLKKHERVNPFNFGNIYEDGNDSLMDGDAAKVLVALARLSPKIGVLLRLVLRIVLCEHKKLLVVCQYPAMQIIIGLTLDMINIKNCVYSSGLSRTQRLEAQDSFNRPLGGNAVMITSYKVGSTGLNLHHACHNMVLFDSAINDGQEQQALGRLRRLGQSRDVRCYELIGVNTFQTEVALKKIDKSMCAAIADLAESGDKSGGDVTVEIEQIARHWKVGGTVMSESEVPADVKAKQSPMSMEEYVYYMLSGSVSRTCV